MHKQQEALGEITIETGRKGCAGGRGTGDDIRTGDISDDRETGEAAASRRNENAKVSLGRGSTILWMDTSEGH